MSRKYSNMDDLFRDRFKDYAPEPPEHIWENIRKKIGSGGNNPFKGSGGITGISTIVILMGLLSFYLLQSYSGKQEFEGISETKALAINDNDLLMPTTESQSGLSINSESKAEVKPNRKSNPKKEKPEIVITNRDETPVAKISLQNANPAEYEENKSNDKTVIGADEQVNFMNSREDNFSKFKVLPKYARIKMEYGSDKTESGNVEIRKDGLDMPVSGTLSRKGSKGDYGKPGSWQLGIFFTPEMLNNPANTNLNTRNYSLDVNAVYRFSGYLVQSGLGAMWSSDNGKDRIDYNQYLGSYEDVYYVSFDTTGGEIIPTYFTETVDVYDTIEHFTIKPTENKYTYLNIPLLFGYGGEGRKFGWFVKAGPSLSVLINKKLTDNGISDNQNRIINVESEVPSRIESNLQVMFTGGATMSIGKNMTLSIEPVFRYYIKSAYEINNIKTKNPYSIGLRAGLLLNL